MKYSSDIAFSPTVKAEQERRGSRVAYARMEQGSSWPTEIDDGLRSFIAERDSLYIATVNRDGQPYIQHRGGPKGFLRSFDDHTLAFADYGGNRQYITLGNLSDNDKVCVFLMDYPNRRRIKVWGTARVVEDDPEVLNRLGVSGDESMQTNRAIVITVAAWDLNCKQFITPRYAEEREKRSSDPISPIVMEKLERRLGDLQNEVETLRQENERLRRLGKED